MTQLVLQSEDPAFIQWFGRLQPIEFSMCMHGGTRRKDTRWLSTPSVYASLQQTCDGQHPHAPYKMCFVKGAWKLDTTSETSYPPLLCQRAVSAACACLRERGHSFDLLPSLRHESLAAQGKQHRRHPPLISEFARIHYQSDADPIPRNGKLLPPRQGGEWWSEEDPEPGLVEWQWASIGTQQPS